MMCIFVVPVGSQNTWDRITMTHSTRSNGINRTTRISMAAALRVQELYDWTFWPKRLSTTHLVMYHFSDITLLDCLFFLVQPEKKGES